MTGRGVTEHVILQVHEKISSSDEVLFEFAAKSGVQAGENARGIMGMIRLASESDFQHGGD